jgi:hypothetical protein
MRACGYLRLAIALPLLCGSLAFSQGIRPLSPRINVGVPPDLSNPFRATNAQNFERQKSLVQDMQQLMKITNELNAVANTNPDSSPSPEILKKLEEIEKLAKHIKQQMKGD